MSEQIRKERKHGAILPFKGRVQYLRKEAHGEKANTMSPCFSSDENTLFDQVNNDVSIETVRKL